MMEAARTSETSVNFYQTTQCYNPEDSHLQELKLLEKFENGESATELAKQYGVGLSDCVHETMLAG
jgi:hypothetical protein